MSSRCFRLLQLKHELQADTKVEKAVVDDVDVLRWCCSLGMATASDGDRARSHNFEFGHFDPRDYDADFARFVRDKIFSASKQDVKEQVKIGCLFGKPREVKEELARIGVFGDFDLADWSGLDQGVYCVERDNEGDGCREFFVFPCLGAKMFAPDNIRDMPALILRFLMSISFNVTCCLSQEDYRQISSEVRALSDSTSKRWSSFSVAFRVQKQQEQSDSISCGPIISTSIPGADVAKRIDFIDGIFPAVAVESKIPSTTEWHTRRATISVEDFADWLMEKHQRFLTSLPSVHCRPACMRDLVLEKFCRVPDDELLELRSNFNNKLEVEKIQIRSSAFEDTRNVFAAVVEESAVLFSIRCSGNASQIDDAIARWEELLTCLGSSGVLYDLDRQTQTTLYLPVRLQTNMKLLDKIFRQRRHRSAFDEVLKAIINDKQLEIDDGSSANIWRVLEDAARGAFSWFMEKDPFSRDFQREMEAHQIRLESGWVEVVESLLPMTRIALQNQRVQQFEIEQQSAYFAEEDAIRNAAFDQLRAELASCNRQLGVEITDLRLAQDESVIEIKWKEEDIKEPSKVIGVYQLGTCDSGAQASSLGTLEFEPGAAVIKLAAVKACQVIAVVVKEGRTSVRLVQFPLEPKYSEDRVTQLELRAFPNVCSLCNIRAQDRRVAFAFGASADRLGRIAVYRFNAVFTTLEMTSSFDMDMVFRLGAPLVDIVLTERSLYAVDAEGDLQSYDTRSRQTSKKVSFGNVNVNAKWVGNVLCFADELVVGRVRAEENGKLWLHSMSSEDNRTLPTLNFPGVGAEDQVVGCHEDILYVIDAGKGAINSTKLSATVRSDAYRIQRSRGGQSTKKGCLQADKTNSTAEHWLRVFYHVFEKFPVQSLIEGDARSEDQFLYELGLSVSGGLDANGVIGIGKKYFDNVMMDLQRLNKPLFGLNLAQNVWTWDPQADRDARNLQLRSLCRVFLTVITFLPIQICRAEDNMLKLLQDSQGHKQQSSRESSGTEASDIAQSLRFGLLSPILESWGGRCVVATSMGKQSTGKSYFLNHLTGTSFAISGSRCTDGAWMSLRVLSPEVLLVVLDFEGLGSFERSEQEDILLSVLNASVSLFTVFRMETRFDKDIDGLFSRFQKGVQLIKNDLRLFRGLLYMSVKDVNMNDRQGVVDELVGKLEAIFQANREQNFLTEMYAGQLEINCSPPFGTVEYYKCMENDATNKLREIVSPSGPATGFSTGNAFLDCLRIVLAKISILDWTSMDQTTQTLLVADVEHKLPGILRTGCLVPQCAIRDNVIPPHLREDVLEFGSHEKMTISMKEVCAEHPGFAPKWQKLAETVPLDSFDDGTFDTGFDVTAAPTRGYSRRTHKILESLFELFLVAQHKEYGTSRLSADDQNKFDVFLAFVLRRRKMKVFRWLHDLLGDRLTEYRVQQEQRIADRLVVRLSRCQHKCASCQLGCMHTITHAIELSHNCCTDHKCRGRCEYAECQGEFSHSDVPACSRSAGHEGKCECEKGEHTCGQECVLSSAPNCDRRCSKRADHLGDHRCSVQLHVCGAACSAETCSGTCLLEIQRDHSVHKCAEVQCLQRCLMDRCTAYCGVKDHFHGKGNDSFVFTNESGMTSEDSGNITEEATPVVHMCAGSHACSDRCEIDGICEQIVHLKKSSRTYKGARGSFEYVFQEMNGRKKHCALVLPSGKQDHVGLVHSCTGQHEGEEGQVHYCAVRCPCCNYYCNKEFDHMGLHSTSHGNMQQTYFMGKSSDVDLDDRKYQVGERGIAEMCNLFCTKMGRGHAHYLACEGEGDVCTADASKDQRRHCVDELFPPPDKPMDELLHGKFWSTIGWEDPCTEQERKLFAKCPFKCNAPEHDEEGNTPSHCLLDAWHLPELRPNCSDDGFAYVGGHKFECVHAVDSGKFHNIFVLDSSGSMSGQPWQNLVNACNEFVHNRLQDGGENDVVSYVTFDHHSYIQCEGKRLGDSLGMALPYSGGGTCFTEGLRAANEVLSRNNFEEFKAVLIFFSDGRPWDIELAVNLAQHIRANYAKYDLKAFVVGFGSVDLAVLHRIASEMGGEYRQILDANALRTEFQRIAAILVNSQASLALLEPKVVGPTAGEA